MSYIEHKVHSQGLQYIEVNSPMCHAHIFLQGAQVTHFQPKNQPSLLWISQAETYEKGVSMRGGIPICWPWFGLHPEPDYPQHGFARHKIWHLERIQESEQEVLITLTLPTSEIETQFWPHRTQLTVTIALSTQLKISLTTQNNEDYPIKFSQALHTYFDIQNIKKLKVDGLVNTPYIEFNQNKHQTAGEVSIYKETDRMYHNASSTQQLKTTQGTIVVKREHSSSCVLWNPWIEKSKRLSNFNQDDYLHMVCLEACNILDDSVDLKPHETFTLSQTIYWQTS
mgnify:CR=1 FL=1|tara:strand:- start:1764 stop:2612 length:849 start_codon:yes stop_codon:yes gene_type:complete